MTFLVDTQNHKLLHTQTTQIHFVSSMAGACGQVIETDLHSKTTVLHTNTYSLPANTKHMNPHDKTLRTDAPSF